MSLHKHRSHLHPDKPGFPGELFRQRMGIRAITARNMKAPRSRVITSEQTPTGGGPLKTLTKPPTERPIMGVGQ